MRVAAVVPNQHVTGRDGGLFYLRESERRTRIWVPILAPDAGSFLACDHAALGSRTIDSNTIKIFGFYGVATVRSLFTVGKFLPIVAFD